MMRILLVVLLLAGVWWAWSTLVHNPPSPIPPGSPIAQLSNVEQDYYRQVFDYVMTATDPGKSYLWETHSAHGKITPLKPFQSKLGSTCRNFKEEYVIGGVDSSGDGVACKRAGNSGWCRLNKNDALTCAMESSGNPLDQNLSGFGGMLQQGKHFIGQFATWLR